MRLALILATALILFAPKAWGCSFRLPKNIKQTVREYFEDKSNLNDQFVWDYVVRVKILQATRVHENASQTAIAEILETFKGNISGIVKITTLHPSSSCEHDFLDKINQELLLVLTERNGELIASGWISSALIDEAGGASYLRYINWENYFWSFFFEGIKQKTYTNEIKENIFMTTFLHYDHEKKEWTAPLALEDVLRKALEIAASCKKRDILTNRTKSAERLKRAIGFYLNYYDPESIPIFNESHSIKGIFINFQRDLTEFKEFQIDLENHKTLDMKDCNFPSPSAFLKTAENRE